MHVPRNCMCALIGGSPANYRGQKLAFARRQILQQSSTLIVHLYFLQVVLSVLF